MRDLTDNLAFSHEYSLTEVLHLQLKEYGEHNIHHLYLPQIQNHKEQKCSGFVFLKTN